jgi:GxxExxY protein
MLHSEITGKILKAFFKVNDTLGYGFLGKEYENAMKIELYKMGRKAEQQKNIRVFYKGTEVGDYYADLVIDDLVIVELKAAESLCPEHEAQLINYLRATKIGRN